MSNSIWQKPTVRPAKDCIVVWQNPARMSFTLPTSGQGGTITQGAKDILDWYVHNVPANQE